MRSRIRRSGNEPQTRPGTQRDTGGRSAGDVEARRDESTSTRLVPRDAECLGAPGGVVFVLVVFFVFVSGAFGLVLVFWGPHGIFGDPWATQSSAQIRGTGTGKSVEGSRRGAAEALVGDGFRAATAASFPAREVARVSSADSMPVSTRLTIS
jgi:hypothetical protein